MALNELVVGYCLLATAALFGSFVLFVSAPNYDQFASPLLIVVSIDAFRYEFLRHKHCKTLQSIRTRPNNSLKMLVLDGIYGPMRVQFPTFTFTNHYSIMTGLYPMYHGLVANNFYDRDKDQVFSSRDVSAVDPSWWLAEPV